MPTFILSLNWTDQGIRGVKEAPKRSKAARDLAKKLGVEIKQIYLTSGEMICSSSLNLQVAITLPNSRLQPVRSETYAPKPLEPGPNPNSQSSYQSCHDWCRRDRFSRSKGLARESGPTNSRADLAF